MRLCIVFILLLASYCTPVKPVQEVHRKTYPIYPLQPKPTKILLLNTYNVAAKKYRDNKEELFIKFIDSMLTVSATEIMERESIPSEVLRGLTTLNGYPDSVIHALMLKYNCTYAIEITNLEIDFRQTGIDVTKTSTGKEREAHYNIECDAGFSVYSGEKLFKQSPMHISRYHSTRNVMSGLLAAGPNIVAQRKDAWKITRDNLEDFLNQFFEGK